MLMRDFYIVLALGFNPLKRRKKKTEDSLLRSFPFFFVFIILVARASRENYFPIRQKYHQGVVF